MAPTGLFAYQAYLHKSRRGHYPSGLWGKHVNETGALTLSLSLAHACVVYQVVVGIGDDLVEPLLIKERPRLNRVPEHILSSQSTGWRCHSAGAGGAIQY